MEEDNQNANEINAETNTDLADNQGEGTIKPETESKTFSQEDINRIVAKEAKKAQEKVLKELGIGEDFKTVNEGLEKYRQWQEANRTDEEKRQIELKTANESILKINKELKQATIINACLMQGVTPNAVNDVAVLVNNIVNDDISIDDAILQVIEKYPQFKNEGKQGVMPEFVRPSSNKEIVNIEKDIVMKYLK